MDRRIPDHYKALGVNRDIKQEELKTKYRQFARANHPDVTNDPEAEERFKVGSMAYRVLADPQQRRAYDVQLRLHGLYGQDNTANASDTPWVSDMSDLYTYVQEVFSTAGMRSAYSSPRQESSPTPQKGFWQRVRTVFRKGSEPMAKI